MSGRARIGIAVAAVVLLLIALFFLLIRPKQNELASVREEIEQEESRTAALQIELRELQEYRDNQAQLEARLQELKEAVPDQDQVGNFVFLVEDAAVRAGVRFAQITPELPDIPPEGAAELAEVRATIGATGGFFAIQDFTRRLYELDRAVRIDNITLARSDEEEGATETEVTLTAIARIFFQNPGQNPDAEL